MARDPVEAMANSRSWGSRRPGARLLVGAVVLTMILATAGTSTNAGYRGRSVAVIVQAAGGQVQRVEDAVESAGGSIERPLPIIHGFSGFVPADALPALRGLPEVVSISEDVAVQPQAAVYDPVGDMNSMYLTTRYTGAANWWAAGYTGAGVDVAVIDSGVSPVEGLATPGKIIYGPDLSIESQASNLANLDTYGHGTFMAGLIAGHDGAMVQPYGQAPASQYRGMAPDARIVSVKVATADGGTDVSQVIAAISWVVQHAHDPGLNIRVLNLSYGTNSTQDYTVDPLSFAVEQAWKKGIVVIAAAGNSGYVKGSGSPCMTDPARNPFVIAVGGTDSMGTSQVKDDKVGAYSAAGAAGCKSPDFVAPGSHLQGLRVPNSYVDAAHPEGLLGDRYFRGSGTSQAAAITSGAVALILQKFPSITPDQVKKYFQTYAYKLSATIGYQQGAGEIQLTPMLVKTPANYSQKFTAATGAGSLELARGTVHLTQDGVVLTGEQDIMGTPFDAAAMAALEAQAKSWSGGDWNAKSWSGDGWSGASWSAKSWSGASWSAKSWSSCVFTSNSWSGASWSGASWSGASWSGALWTGDAWATGSWS